MARPGEAVNANATATIFSFRQKQSDLTQGLEISIRSSVTKSGYWAGSGEGRGEDGERGEGREESTGTGRGRQHADCRQQLNRSENP